MVLDHRGLPYDDVVTRIDIDRSQEGKTVFLYRAEIVGDLDPQVKEHVLAVASKCPVRKTLSQEIVFAPLT